MRCAEVDHLSKLVKEAEDCSVVLSCDIIGATLNYRTTAAKDWLSRCREVCKDLMFNCAAWHDEDA